MEDGVDGEWDQCECDFAGVEPDEGHDWGKREENLN